MDSGSKIETDMYEACEYFETAVLKYSQWTQYNDNSYKLAGDEAIDDMNEKSDHMMLKFQNSTNILQVLMLFLKQWININCPFILFLDISLCSWDRMPSFPTLQTQVSRNS